MDSQTLHELTDAVVDSVRARRRRWAVLASCAAVLTVATAVPIAVTSGHRSGTHARAGVSPTDLGPAVDPAGTPGESGAIYLAVFEYAAPSSAGPLWVITHTCMNILAAGSGDCRPQPLAGDVQDYLAAHVANRITWVDASPTTIENPQRGTLVTLGPIDYRAADLVHVAVETWCGGDCAEGKTLVVERTGTGAWQVTGTTGPQWIS